MSLFAVAICLVSGGMGLTNTSLMSVRDRTREIGIRVAVGARARDIWLQFLMEALAALGAFFASWAAEVTSWPPIITVRSDGGDVGPMQPRTSMATKAKPQVNLRGAAA